MFLKISMFVQCNR